MSFLTRIREVLGHDSPLNSVAQMLKGIGDRIEIAERLCKEAGDPPGLFAALEPSPILWGYHGLYEPHAKEIVQRFKAGEDLGPGTKAEVLAGLMQTSLKTPLTSSGLALAEKLFRECSKKDLGADLGREAYPGELEERLAEARQKLRVERNKGGAGSKKQSPS